MTITDMSNRQILANLGNRFVVFGPPTQMPRTLAFHPEDVQTLPRVADEAEAAEHRIVETLRVQGLTRLQSEPADPEWDIAFQDDMGGKLYVDVKARDGQPRTRDYERAFQHSQQALSEHRHLETWFFNIDRLSLTVIGIPDRQRESHFTALDVWEKTAGGVFRRDDVVRSVTEWERAIHGLFKFIKEALADLDQLQFDTDRKVTMSEELMHKYAVPDRELPILDVIHAGEVLASFVPRARWVVGSSGRVDLITRSGTVFVVRTAKTEDAQWQWVEQSDRRQMHPFDRDALRRLVK